MAYEVLVLDVDGTLMRTDKTISRKTIDEIVKIQEKGICVAIASGRCTAGIMPTARKIRLDEFGGYIVSYNGACISNAKTGKVIYNINLPDGIVPEIYEFSKREKTGIMTYHDNDIIAENDADQYIQIDAKGCDIDIHVVEDFGKEVTYTINKCRLTGDPDWMTDVEPKAAKAFEGRLSV
ncbi:MAG: HAD-IIB family hydrolase, partial [Eubacterium sp.]